jgi:hypothetical protein
LGSANNVNSAWILGGVGASWFADDAASDPVDVAAKTPDVGIVKKTIAAKNIAVARSAASFTVFSLDIDRLPRRLPDGNQCTLLEAGLRLA